MSHATYLSSIGPIFVTARDAALTGLTIGKAGGDDRSDAIIGEALAQLDAWFAGRLVDFDLPLDPLTTPRGEAHRAAMIAIPYGETQSYGEIARHIASSPRAVGQACRRNPLPIIVPCHRVLAAGGAIGHYSAGDGVPTKAWLLQHERQRKG